MITQQGLTKHQRRKAQQQESELRRQKVRREQAAAGVAEGLVEVRWCVELLCAGRGVWEGGGGGCALGVAVCVYATPACGQEKKTTHPPSTINIYSFI